VARVGQRPIALGTLTRPDALLATFDADRESVARALAGLMPRPDAPLAALPALARAAAAIHETGAPFSAIVVLSAAADRVPDVGDDTLARILDSGATIHAVAIRPSGAPAARDVVRELSDQTRGRFTTIYTAASFQAAVDRLADELSTEILI